MREIIFRGMRIDNGQWIWGDFISSASYPKRAWITECKTIFDMEICEIGVCEVGTSTVGQYTGLTDKNGVKIFEGDIVSAKNNICGETYRFLVEFGVCGGVENAEHPVGFPCFFFKEATGVIPSEYMMRKDPVYFMNAYKCEVIGNAYDNPELISGAET